MDDLEERLEKLENIVNDVLGILINKKVITRAEISWAIRERAFREQGSGTRDGESTGDTAAGAGVSTSD